MGKNKNKNINIEFIELAKYGNSKYHRLSDGFICDEIMTELNSLHWHKEIEFTLLTEGEINIFIENQQFTLHKNDVIIVNSKQIHVCEYTFKDKCSYFSISVDEKFFGATDNDNLMLKYIGPIFNRDISIDSLFKCDNCQNSFLVETLKKIDIILEKKEYGYELLIRAYLYEIVFWLYKENKYSVKEAKNESPTIKEIKKIIKYINENYMEDITIDDLSKLSNLSNDYLIRVFTKIARQTPVAYINFVRLQKAAHLLKNLDTSVSEIAVSVGFNNISYFSKMFKRQYDCSPSEFKSNYFNQLKSL